MDGFKMDSNGGRIMVKRTIRVLLLASILLGSVAQCQADDIVGVNPSDVPAVVAPTSWIKSFGKIACVGAFLGAGWYAWNSWNRYNVAQLVKTAPNETNPAADTTKCTAIRLCNWRIADIRDDLGCWQTPAALLRAESKKDDDKDQNASSYGPVVKAFFADYAIKGKLDVYRPMPDNNAQPHASASSVRARCEKHYDRKEFSSEELDLIIRRLQEEYNFFNELMDQLKPWTDIYNQYAVICKEKLGCDDKTIPDLKDIPEDKEDAIYGAMEDCLTGSQTWNGWFIALKRPFERLVARKYWHLFRMRSRVAALKHIFEKLMGNQPISEPKIS